MLSILRERAFVFIFKSMALYVAFYEIASKWRVHRLWDKSNLGTNSDPPVFRLCDFERCSCPLCAWFLTVYRLFLAFSYMIMLLLPSLFLRLTILLLAWTDATTMPAFIRYNVTTKISKIQFLSLLRSQSSKEAFSKTIYQIQYDRYIFVLVLCWNMLIDILSENWRRLPLRGDASETGFWRMNRSLHRKN